MTDGGAYLAVLRTAKVDDDSTLVVDTHVPEVSHSFVEWQLSRDEGCFAHETLHSKMRYTPP